MIKVTEAAADKISSILQADGAKALRVFVQGGGCSGFQYGFKLENEEPAEDDKVLYLGTYSVIIDQMSMMYLDGATIDYKEELLGARFVLDNPNVKATCGCGSSFTTD